MTAALPAAVRIRFSTRLELVRPLRKILVAVLEAQGWPGDALEDAALVATEVLQNAVEHGSRHDGSEEVGLVLHVLEDACELEVHDPGTGKGPHSLLGRDPAQPPDPSSDRGRGLFLVHRLAVGLERVRVGEGACVRVRLSMHGKDGSSA
ncbi:MAG: ATP-binding protein [Planctomycetia bacterium]